jgi:glycosyltransferase involved in cell wall biosynthesis
VRFRTERNAAKVLVLAPYPTGVAPNQRFRFEQYVGRLDAEGIHFDVSSFLSPRIIPVLHAPGHLIAKAGAVVRGMIRRVRDVYRARSYDAVLVSREATPIGYPWVERLLVALGVPYAFDFDDAIYLQNVSAANRGLGRLKFASKTAIIARHASLVIAGNPHLADWARRQGANVTLIPTTIDTDQYVLRSGSSEEQQPVCIGWSGSVTTSAYLDAIAPLLADLQRQHGIRIRVIGDSGYRIASASVDALPWRAESEVADLSAIDIGVMPLPDDEWARGKCGLKALQYMALGIPTVMSPVGVNRTIAGGDAARLADSLEEWREALTELILDRELRLSLGQRGRERVERDYSVAVMAPRWASALHTTIQRGGASDG